MTLSPDAWEKEFDKQFSSLDMMEIRARLKGQPKRKSTNWLTSDLKLFIRTNFISKHSLKEKIEEKIKQTCYRQHEKVHPLCEACSNLEVCNYCLNDLITKLEL